MSDIKELIADATDAGRKLGISQMTFGADRRKQELIEAQNKLLSEIAAMEAVVQAAVNLVETFNRVMSGTKITGLADVTAPYEQAKKEFFAAVRAYRESHRD
jgi:hypothetical protein